MTLSETLLINGKWSKGHGPELISFNPANGEIIWQGLTANAADIDLAVKSASLAFPDWAYKSFEDRIGYLLAYRDSLTDRRDRLAEVISQETGKPLWESHTEVNAMVNKIEISVDAYMRRCADYDREQPQGATSFTRHKPHGVIAVLGPFNFPGHLPNGHIVPALLAGNTVVFKPSEYTPLVAQEMLLCWEQAKLPAGVINLVQGAGLAGKNLANHPQIDGLFFTGSYATGKILSEAFAKTPEKILALEMGGNNPLIVHNVSDLRAAAYMTIQSAYLTSGQRCSCARRLIVPIGTPGDDFLDMLVQWTQRIKVGVYTEDPQPFMGPVASELSLVRLQSAQAMLLSKGGKILVELTHLQEKGYLLSPGLIDVTGVKDRPDEEFFGPLLQVIRVHDFEEAIQEANKTAYGLTAGLLSDRHDDYELFYRKVKAGVINWNTPLTGASSSAPFGGIGRSGNHRPSAYYAADYCSYPVASMESPSLTLPAKLTPGIEV